MNLYKMVLFLEDLLQRRGAALDQSAMAKAYRPILAAYGVSLEELPEVLRGKALADELGEEDAIYDVAVVVLFFITEVVLRDPDVSAELKASAERVRETFAPALGETQKKYTVEASRAKQRRKVLADLEGDLKALKHPDGVRDAYVIAERGVTAGEKIDELLSGRADATPESRAEASLLLSKGIGMVNRMRSAVRDELGCNEDLPRDLEKQIFAYWDDLQKSD